MGLFDNKKRNDYKARCQMQIGELEDCANGCKDVKAYAAVNNVAKILRSKQNKPYVFDKKALDKLFASITTLIADIKSAVAHKQEEAISLYSGILAEFLMLNVVPGANNALTDEKVAKLREGIAHKSILEAHLKTKAETEKELSELDMKKVALAARCQKILAEVKSGTMNEAEIAAKEREYRSLKEDEKALLSSIGLKESTLDKIKKQIAFEEDFIAITKELETVVFLLSDNTMTAERFEQMWQKYAEMGDMINVKDVFKESVKQAYAGATSKQSVDMSEFNMAKNQGAQNKAKDDAFRYEQNKH